ncbi:MAG: cytochrome c [Lacunisphaera sp.]
MLQQALSLGEYRQPAALAKLLDLARVHGLRPIVADAIVSGIAGRETDFLALALAQPDAGNALITLRIAATSVWRSDNVAAITRLDQLLGAADAPAWAAHCTVDSLKAFIPAQNDGKMLTAHLPVAPSTLLRVAGGTSPQAGLAKKVRDHLRWPGNEGPVVVVTPLTAAQQKIFEKGREIFTTICAGCHQPNGQGLKGLAPSLVTSKWVAGDERAVARIVLQGKISEGLVMPPLAALDDESLAGALTFVAARGATGSIRSIRRSSRGPVRKPPGALNRGATRNSRNCPRRIPSRTDPLAHPLP